ncbi:hypothetical protein [Lysobacter gummosus]|uniref:hypothetical protein n=1 Tax=Lysobacter gummosus TaxID=262324 RepID=UPI0036419113
MAWRSASAISWASTEHRHAQRDGLRHCDRAHEKARFGGLFRGRDKAFGRRFIGREIDVFEDVFSIAVAPDLGLCDALLRSCFPVDDRTS